MNSLNTRSMIFTLYGDYISHYGNEIWTGSLIQLLKEFGHNQQAVRAALSRMSKQGWVKARRDGNKSYYYLTDRGVLRINEAARRIFKLMPEQWDGQWRMLMYTIPEQKRHLRDELRKELIWSGFGPLANSVWVSPNSLEKEIAVLLDKYEIHDYIEFFVASYHGPRQNTKLVEKCWDLSAINGKYQTFIAEYSPRYHIDQDKIANGEMSTAQCFVERTKLVHEYRKFLFVDPGLPEELLPKQWLGNRAAALFSDYYKALAPYASQFFEKVFSEGNELTHKDDSYNVLEHPFIIE